jgi:flagellar export protein FliJ
VRRRAERTSRLAQVQARLQQREEWKLQELQRRRAEVEAAEREVMAALGADNALHGLFLDAMARRLGALGRDAARLKSEEVAQRRRLLAAAARLKVAERLAERAAREARREADKAELADVMDEAVARSDTSLR